MNEEEVRRLVLQQALALRKRDREQVLQQKSLMEGQPNAEQALEDLAQKLIVARQAELRRFASQLDSQRGTLGGLDAAADNTQREAGALFDAAGRGIQAGQIVQPIRRLETAQEIAPNPATLRALELARSRRPQPLIGDPKDGCPGSTGARLRHPRTL